MEEKDKDEVEFLNHAAAWLPSNRDLEENEAFYFARKKTDCISQDIRSFFTPPGHDQRTKKRKRKYRTDIAAETPPNPHSKRRSDEEKHSITMETLIDEDEDDYDFQAVKKYRPSIDLSCKKYFGTKNRHCKSTQADTPKHPETVCTPKDCYTTSSSEETNLLTEEDLPKMKSNRKHRCNTRGKMRSMTADVQQGKPCNDHNTTTHEIHGIIRQDENVLTSGQESSQSQRHNSQSHNDSSQSLYSKNNQQECDAIGKEDTTLSTCLSADEVVPDTTWSCCACTFDNHVDLPFCEICHTPKKTTRSLLSKPFKKGMHKNLSETCSHQGLEDSCNHRDDSKAETDNDLMPVSQVNNTREPSYTNVESSCSPLNLNIKRPSARIKATVEPKCTDLTIDDIKSTQSSQILNQDQILAKEIEDASSCYLALINSSIGIEEPWRCAEPNCGTINTNDECEACWSPKPEQFPDAIHSTSIKASQIYEIDQNESTDVSSDPVNDIEAASSCSSQTGNYEEPMLFESFLYCPSKHTDRIYLYDQDGTPLNCSFLAIDLQHHDMDALPSVLRHQHNLRIALRFLREWNSLNNIKRKQIRKTGALIDSPLATLQALKQQQHHYQPCTKRYLTKVDLAMAAKQTAQTLGGSVRVISKTKPVSTSKRRFIHQHTNQSLSDSNPSCSSGNEEQNLTKSKIHLPALTTAHKPKITRRLNMNTISQINSNQCIPTGSSHHSDSQSDTKYLESNTPTLKRGTYVQALDGNGRPLCVFCGKVTASSTAVETHRGAAWDMRYCSERCKQEHSCRWSSSKYVRGQLLETENGVCQLCGLKAQQLYNNIKDAAKCDRKELLKQSTLSKLSTPRLNEIIRNPSSGQFWHADHVVAVMEGGGLCSLDNFRTLCVLCHEKVTAEQNMRRRSRQKSAGITDIRSFFKS